MDPALQDKLDRLPTGPGVYLMKDREGRIVYVGKAVNLRARVRGYFNRAGSDARAFIPLLDGLLSDIETVLTSTEKEALILESTLIKKHRPRFNVMLRDDKSFICLRLDARAAYPRLEIVRAKGQRTDGASYFGPYSSASSIRETLRVVNRHFQLRSCTDREMASRSRPCIEQQIGRCPAPCCLDVPAEGYAESVAEVSLFLSGRGGELAAGLEARMNAAAEAERFEDAARLRDQLRAVARSLERQRVVQGEGIDQDVFGVHREGPHLSVALLSVRRGRLQESRRFDFKRQEFPTDELLASLIGLYYDGGAEVPRELLVPLPLETGAAIGQWLTEKSGHATSLLCPQRGEKRRLVEMANANALQAARERTSHDQDAVETAARLQHQLNLSRPPRRIECYDISNFQGTEVVASKVAFEDGQPDKARYRRFRIKSFVGQDDFASLYEVLCRRLARGKAEGDLPDLLVIDGGKGQLQVAQAALRDQEVLGVDVVSLAKSRVLAGVGEGGETRHSPERVFLPGVKDPVVLRPNSSELFVLQRLRDEAHRFAIGYHRKLRDRRTLRSALDRVPGVGPARRRALLARFGSVKGVREADPAALALLPGVTLELAGRILDALREPSPDPAEAASDG